MNILVAGATGKTGIRVTEQLREQGHTPIALVRDSSDTSALASDVVLRKGDLTNLTADACEGCDAVIFAAGSGGSTGPEMTDKVDRDGANPSQPTCTAGSHSRQRPCAPALWPTCTGRKLPTTLTEGPCAESAPGSVCPPVQPRPHTMTREILLWIPFGQNLHPFSPNECKEMKKYH